MKLKNILNEGARVGSRDYRNALRAAAEGIIKEAETEMRDQWKNMPNIKDDYKTRKEFFENELRDFTNNLVGEFVEQLEDEVDVVLTHKHGI